MLELARQAVTIEKHYGRPMDIEWAKDGETGELFIVQARPETVKARASGVGERYVLEASGEVRISGRAIGQKIGAGAVRVIASPAEMNRVQPGDVLVTDMTDPDWEPVMKRAAAIVTNRGGRTCHAAIVARELGIPAVVGTRRGDHRVEGWRGGDGVVRRGRHRHGVRRQAGVHGGDAGERDAAGAAGQADDERRQSRARVRVRADSESRRRPGAAGIHHRAHDRRASAGAAGICQPDRPRCARKSICALPAMPIRCPSTSTSWPRASPPWPRRSGRSR